MKRLTDIFFQQDVTAAWPRQVVPALAFSLPGKALNDVVFGDAYEKLSIFGRPDNEKPCRFGRFEYRSLGLIVETERGRIAYFAFVMRDEDGYQPCRVRVAAAAAGRPCELNEETSLKDVRRIFGDPAEEGDDETILVYRQHGVGIEAECDEQGLLQSLHVFALR